MWTEGKVYKAKQGNKWLAELPSLDIYTEARTEKKAMEMLADALSLLAESDGYDLSIKVKKGSNGAVYAGADDGKTFLAFMLKRMRLNHGLSISAVAARMGSTSKTAYARYEQAKSEPTISKLQELVEALCPGATTALTIGTTS